MLVIVARLLDLANSSHLGHFQDSLKKHYWYVTHKQSSLKHTSIDAHNKYLCSINVP
jgi:hypothetical protein